MQLILVISRDTELNKAITGALDASWSRVWTCMNPKDAINMVGQQEPAVIIVDGRTDLVSQLEIVKKLKKGLHLDHISCLLFASLGSEKIDPMMLADYGVDETMAWPSPVPIISHKVRLLIDKNDAKKVRKSHFLEATADSNGGILKSDSQYDDIPPGGDPFRLNRKSLFVVDAEKKAPVGHDYEKPKGIELPDDFFENSSEVDLEKPSLAGEPSKSADEFSLNTLGRSMPPKLVEKPPSETAEAFRHLTPEHLDELAAKILEQKLTTAAKENIRKLIAKSVRQELNKLMPEIVSYVKKQLG